jgi:hypothetical protein
VVVDWSREAEYDNEARNARRFDEARYGLKKSTNVG